MLEIIREVCQKGGDLGLSFYGNVTPSEKADRSFVTEADQSVERLIRAELARSCPEIPVLGEEYGIPDNMSPEKMFVVDPIDGTANFVAGIPVWATCIGYLENGVSKAGAVYFPVLKDMFYAEAGAGAKCNDKFISVHSEEIIRRDDLFGLSTNILKELSFDFPCKLRSLGAAVACMTNVAKGSFIGSAITDCFLWDVAAATVIVREAGATVFNWDGTLMEGFDVTGSLKEKVPPILITPPQLKDQVRKLVTINS